MCGRGALQTIAEWFYTFTGGGVNDWAQVVVLVGRPFCLCWLNKDACRWWFGGGCWQYRTWMVSLFCIPCRIFRVMFRQLCYYINYLPRYVRTSELHSAVPSHSINQGRPHTAATPQHSDSGILLKIYTITGTCDEVSAFALSPAVVWDTRRVLGGIEHDKQASKRARVWCAKELPGRSVSHPTSSHLG